jgi:hypothetical protein
MSEKTPRSLTSNCRVRLEKWNKVTYAWLEALSNPEDIARAKKNKHDIAYVVYTGSTIADSTAFYNQELQRAKDAVTLEPGELIEVNGKTYKVRVVKGNEINPRNSDPIKLDPVE